MKLEIMMKLEIEIADCIPMVGILISTLLKAEFATCNPPHIHYI